MNKVRLEILAGVCLLFAPAFSAAGTAVGAEERAAAVSGEITAYAREKGINRIAVVRFLSAGGAESGEAALVSERISSHMNTFRKTTPAERHALEKTLAALKKPSSAGGAEEFRDMFSVDAVVVGAVSEFRGKITVSARLIDARTGKVFFTARAGGIPSPPSAELPGFSGPYPWWESETTKSAPGGLRDAVSDYAENNPCAAGKKRLAKLNAELAGAKAAYWAAKIQEPLFRRRTLDRNPGIEIADPAVRSRFYELLAERCREGKSGRAALADVPAVLDLIESETRFFAECGLP